jgi:hypothetical protein
VRLIPSVGEPSATVLCGSEQQLLPLEHAPLSVKGSELHCSTRSFGYYPNEEATAKRRHSPGTPFSS